MAPPNYLHQYWGRRYPPGGGGGGAEVGGGGEVGGGVLQYRMDSHYQTGCFFFFIIIIGFTGSALPVFRPFPLQFYFTNILWVDVYYANLSVPQGKYPYDK